jgi:hypothetical protein
VTHVVVRDHYGRLLAQEKWTSAGVSPTLLEDIAEHLDEVAARVKGPLPENVAISVQARGVNV